MHLLHDDDDDHPELPPRLDVWMAERGVVSAAARLRELEAAEGEAVAIRAAQLDYRTAWLRFMVSLCNLPLGERPEAVEHVMEALREAHLLRPPGSADRRSGTHGPTARPDPPPGGQG